MSTTALQQSEQQSLAAHEEVIERGLIYFIEVGNALVAIRDAKLYRATHKTFEDYCRQRWKMAQQSATRLIRAAESVTNLKTEPIGSLPDSESVTRPLTKLPPEEQRAAWKEAVETAPDGKVTASHVEAVVRRRHVDDIDPKLLAEANRRAKEAEEDSEKLWTLKSTWRRTGKRDREKFLKWVKTVKTQN